MRQREMPKESGVSALEADVYPQAFGTPSETKRRNILYFTRSAGFEDSVVQRQGARMNHSEKLLVEMGRRAGFRVESTRDGSVFERDLDAYDVIVFYTSGDLTQPASDGSLRPSRV